MQYWMTEDQHALREMVAAFTRNEIEPLANAIDASETIPDALIGKIAELGIYGLYTSPQYGGMGQDVTSVSLVMEEIAKASPALAGMLAVQVVLCPRTVEILGTEEQKQRILPRSATGERVMAYSQSEPSGAANVASHLSRCLPDREGAGWRLDGAKLFCTRGHAKSYLVMCKTRDRAGSEGYGCVIVDDEATGFSAAPHEHKLGWRGTNTGAIAFDDVHIAPEDVLGELLTGGFMHRAANHANILAHSAASLGGAQGLFDKTIEYVKERRLYGKNMTELQPISYWLAESHAKIAACRSLLYDTTRAFDAAGGVMPPGMGNICKAFIGEACFDVSVKLLQMWGGSGIMDATGVNRYMRDMRAQCVAEGSTETHYAIVANMLLHGNPTLIPPDIVKTAG